MLKTRSLSTDDGGEHSILFATFPSSEYAAISFPPLTGIHFSWSSGRRQHSSSSLFRVRVDNDLQAFLSLFFSVMHRWCCIWWRIIAARVRGVCVSRRVTASRAYIIRISDLRNQFNISGGRAAVVFIALLISLQRLGTAEARLTVRHASNWTKTEHGLNTNQTSAGLPPPPTR